MHKQFKKKLPQTTDHHDNSNFAPLQSLVYYGHCTLSLVSNFFQICCKQKLIQSAEKHYVKKPSLQCTKTSLPWYGTGAELLSCSSNLTLASNIRAFLKKSKVYSVSLYMETQLYNPRYLTFEYESVKVLVRFEYGLVNSYSDTALRLEVNRPQWCTTKRRSLSL